MAVNVKNVATLVMNNILGLGVNALVAGKPVMKGITSEQLK